MIDTLDLVCPGNEDDLRRAMAFDICDKRGMKLEIIFDVARLLEYTCITDKDGGEHRYGLYPNHDNWRQLYRIIDEVSGSKELAHLY